MKQTDKAIQQLRENVVLCLEEAKKAGRPAAFGLPAECQLAMVDEILAARKMRDLLAEALPKSDEEATRIGTVVGRYDRSRGETKGFFGVTAETVAPPDQEVKEWSHTIKASAKDAFEESETENKSVDEIFEEAKEEMKNKLQILDEDTKEGLWSRLKSIWSKA